MISELLEYIACHYLKNTSQINRLHKEQETYHKLLTEWANYHFEIKKNQQLFFNEELNKVASTILWVRLLMLRLRTLFMEGLQVATSLKELHARMERVDLLVQPVFLYSGWLLHCGRLLHNSLSLMQHIIPGAWMSEREKSIGLTVRMEVHLQRQWVELANDMLWLISVLTPPILFFPAVNFVLELFIAGVHAWIEIRHLKTALNELQVGLLEETASVRYLKQLIVHELKKLLLRITNILSTTTLITLKSILPTLVPALAFNPIVPLVIAFLMLTITLASYFLNKRLEAQTPNDKIELIKNNDKTLKSSVSNNVTFFTPQKTKRLNNENYLNFKESNRPFGLTHQLIFSFSVK